MLAVDDILRVSAEGHIGAQNQQSINVFYLRATVVVDGADAQVIADLEGYLTAIWTHFDQHLSNDFVLINMRTENVTQQVILPDEDMNIVGQAADAILPTQTCAFSWAKTAVKRVMARKFWAGFTEAANDTNGDLVQTVKDDVKSGATEWITAFTGGSGNQYQPSVARNTQPPTLPPLWTADDLISTQTAEYWRTQRRRTTTSRGA